MSTRGQCRASSVLGGLAEALLDAQQLVVLGDTIAACRSPGLDLAAVGGDGEIGDRGRLRSRRCGGSSRLVYAWRDGQLDGVEGLAQRADLVDLDQHAVGDLTIDAHLQPRGVGDEQIVADELDRTPDAPG